MRGSLLRLFRLVCLFLRGYQTLVLENLALRQQLSIYKRKQKRPRLTPWDRLFWIALAGYWDGSREHLFVVHPDTVVRWHRQQFARYRLPTETHNEASMPTRDPIEQEPSEIAAP